MKILIIEVALPYAVHPRINAGECNCPAFYGNWLRFPRAKVEP